MILQPAISFFVNSPSPSAPFICVRPDTDIRQCIGHDVFFNSQCSKTLLCALRGPKHIAEPFHGLVAMKRFFIKGCRLYSFRRKTGKLQYLRPHSERLNSIELRPGILPFGIWMVHDRCDRRAFCFYNKLICRHRASCTFYPPRHRGQRYFGKFMIRTIPFNFIT